MFATLVATALSGATLLGKPGPQDSGTFEDPAPPAVRELAAVDPPAAQPYPELTTHRAPRALAEGAVVEDWPEFLGPRRDGHSRERPLDLDFPASGPPLVWEMERGQGYASPAIANGRLVFTHRLGDEAIIDCLDPTTGQRFWRHRYPCEYAGRYIDNGGPRSTPTIAKGRVYVHGVEGVLTCLDLATGRVVWARDTTNEFAVGDDFFGVVASPLVHGDLLIQNIGAPNGPSVAAFDRHTGRLVWGVGTKWGPSCASPVLAEVHGRERLFVLAGGESRPPTGGLMVIDPATGGLQGEYAFRSRTYESVNGASPVVAGDRVYLTSSYSVGSAALAIGPDGALSELWKNRHFGLQFSTPALDAGRLWGIDGVSGRSGALVALDPATGEERSRTTLAWDEEVDGKSLGFSVGEGSLLFVDNRVLVLGDAGHLLALETDGAEPALLARATLFHAAESWAPLVISRGLLYVCQNNRARFGDSGPRLLCYDLRGAGGGR